MQLWPFYMAAAGIGAAVTFITDRAAFVSYVVVLIGLVAMRYAVHMPFFLGPLTVWSVVAVIVISTNPSIPAGILAFLIPVPYLLAVFGWPASHAYFWSDIAGIGLLLVLLAPTVGPVFVDSWKSATIPHWLGLDSARAEPRYPRGLRPAAVAAFKAMGRAQTQATPEALERCE